MSVEQNESDLAGLSALVGGSEHPESPTMEDDDAVLDLRALASSSEAPPEASEEDDGRVSLAPESAPEKTETSAKEKAPVVDASVEAKAKPEAAQEKAAVAAVAATVVEPQAKGNSGMLMGVLLGGAVAAGVAFFMMNRQPDAVAENDVVEVGKPVAAAEPAQPVAAQPATPPAAAEPGLPLADVVAPAAAVEPALAAPAAAVGTAGTSSDRVARPRKRVKGTKAAPSSEMTTAPVEKPAEVAMTQTPKMNDRSGVSDDVNSLLDQAIGGAPVMAAEPKKEEPKPAANLPETPSKSVIRRALGGLMPKIRRCAGEQVGMANARIKVRNDGSVASVNVAGRPFGGTPQGACMEKVVKTARFPRFKQTTFDVSYPFSVRPLD